MLTDVVGSTKAIEAGRYRDVNALGVASIIAVCNAMRDIEVPFVFGGDGATLLVPRSRRAATERALRGVRALAASAFDLGVRASIVPLEDLAADGHVARVARFRVSDNVRLAMFSGSAFSEAEHWFKDETYGPRYAVADEGEAEADFNGFECRWQPLRSRRGQTVSLIVRALAPTDAARSAIYDALLQEFDRIVDADKFHPVSRRSLKLAGVFGDYSTEARVRTGAAGGPAYDAAVRHVRWQTVIGQLANATGTTAGEFDGRRYRREFINNCDFRKFDDTLRMVVDLNGTELVRLERYLRGEHAAGRLAYGMHTSDSALVTCVVRSYRGDHLHFVDGSDGGYTLASKQLKGQMEGKGKGKG